MACDFAIRFLIYIVWWAASAWNFLGVSLVTSFVTSSVSSSLLFRYLSKGMPTPMYKVQSNAQIQIQIVQGSMEGNQIVLLPWKRSVFVWFPLLDATVVCTSSWSCSVSVLSTPKIKNWKCIVMSRSCHFVRASNDKVSVKFWILIWYCHRFRSSWVLKFRAHSRYL